MSFIWIVPLPSYFISSCLQNSTRYNLLQIKIFDSLSESLLYILGYFYFPEFSGFYFLASWTAWVIETPGGTSLRCVCSGSCSWPPGGDIVNKVLAWTTQVICQGVSLLLSARFYSSFYSQCLSQCPGHRKCQINIWWVKVNNPQIAPVREAFLVLSHWTPTYFGGFLPLYKYTKTYRG